MPPANEIQCYIVQGAFEKARDLARKHLQRLPDAPVLMCKYAMCLGHTGKPDEAISHYQAALAIKPDCAAAYANLGGIYLFREQVDESERCYRAALSIRPAYAEVFDNLLVCHHYDPAVNAEQMFEAHREWARRFAIVPVAGVLLDAAAQLAASSALRAYDSVQLATAMAARNADEHIDTFACFDRDLRRAAATHGFTLLPATM